MHAVRKAVKFNLDFESLRVKLHPYFSPCMMFPHAVWIWRPDCISKHSNHRSCRGWIDNFNTRYRYLERTANATFMPSSTVTALVTT